MIYLKPLVRKLTNNQKTIEKASQLKSDRELLDLLLKETSLHELKSTFAHHYGIEYVRLQAEEINKELIGNFAVSFLKKQMILPYHFNSKRNQWKFAISDLTNRGLQSEISRAVGQKEQSASFSFAFKHEIEEIYEKLDENVEEIEVEENISHDAITWVDTIIGNGIELKASDIHIEREKEGLKVRYRVDGAMTRKRTFDMNDSEISNIYVRLKLVGNMDISEKRKSQDGRVDHYEYKGNMYSLRVSTVNTIHGEKFAMRLFSESEETASFNELGFTQNQENKVTEMINKSNGIIYLAGATGSGKTTTLYAMINKLDKDELNIYTIESPVEKSIEGVNQVQIDEAYGNTYPSVLKTLLRQDPDIMVVGEIREAETSRLAVQSSLTGHLVMTTIHANSALDSISRLVDMGVENYLIGASSVGFLSQRLVRVLCPTCKRKVERLHEHEKVWIESEIPNFDYEYEKRKGNYLYEEMGCDECVNGYKGRIAVLEIIEVDNDLKAMISKGSSTKDIAEYLSSTDYRNMKHDGIMKALSGTTSIQELISKLQN